MNEEFIMRPGDVFVADECGCSVSVHTGPSDESMAMQAPMCCCGHPMHKQMGASDLDFTERAALSDASLGNEAGRFATDSGAPVAMAD